MRLTPFAALLLSAACASAGARENAAAAAAGPDRDRVEVAVGVPKAQATERVLAAFIAESLTVARNEGGVVRSTPIYPRAAGLEMGGSVTYVATVISESDSASRVIVIAEIAGDAGHGRPRPMRSRESNPVFRQHWPRVERIAAAVGGR